MHKAWPKINSDPVDNLHDIMSWIHMQDFVGVPERTRLSYVSMIVKKDND